MNLKSTFLATTLLLPSSVALANCPEGTHAVSSSESFTHARNLPDVYKALWVVARAANVDYLAEVNDYEAKYGSGVYALNNVPVCADDPTSPRVNVEICAANAPTGYYSNAASAVNILDQAGNVIVRGERRPGSSSVWGQADLALARTNFACQLTNRVTISTASGIGTVQVTRNPGANEATVSVTSTTGLAFASSEMADPADLFRFSNGSTSLTVPAHYSKTYTKGDPGWEFLDFGEPCESNAGLACSSAFLAGQNQKIGTYLSEAHDEALRVAALNGIGFFEKAAEAGPMSDFIATGVEVVREAKGWVSPGVSLVDPAAEWGLPAYAPFTARATTSHELAIRALFP